MIKLSPSSNSQGSPCTSPPERQTVRPLQVNLQDHCFLCLASIEQSVLTETLVNNPKCLGNFQPLIYYLTGINPTDTAQQSKLLEENKYFPIVGNMPPMCVQCYDLLGDMYNLHLQLVAVQVQLQRQIHLARETVRGTVKQRKRNKSGRMVQTRKNDFFREIGTGMSCSLSSRELDGVRYFLDNLHSLVIDAGDRYTFPSPPQTPNNTPSSSTVTNLKNLSYPVQFVTPIRPAYQPSLSTVAHNPHQAESEMIFVSGNDQSIKFEVEDDEEDLADNLYIKEDDEDSGGIVSEPEVTSKEPYPVSHPVPVDIPVDISRSGLSSASILYKTSSKLDDLTCEVCGKRCIGNTALLRHVKLVHKHKRPSVPSSQPYNVP